MDSLAIIRRLLHVALPILLSSVVGLFAPLVSVAILGRENPASLYILGLYLPLSFLQTYVNESLRVSAVAFSSRAAGQRQYAAPGSTTPGAGDSRRGHLSDPCDRILADKQAVDGARQRTVGSGVSRLQLHAGEHRRRRTGRW